MDEINLLKQELEKKDKIIAVLFDKIASMQEKHINQQQGIGNNELHNEHVLQEIGKSDANNSNLIQVMDNIEMNNTNSLLQTGISEANISKQLHEIGIIEMNNANTLALQSEIKKLFAISSKKRTLRSTANVMLYLHNHPNATRQELTKAAGLSAPGFAKHFLRLRNKGLLKKLSWKEYALTENSKAILYRAFGKSK